MLKCTIADEDKLYRQSDGAGDSATMPPPLQRSCDETCYMNREITISNKHKPPIRIKLLTFNEKQFLDSKFVTYCEMPTWEANTFVWAVDTIQKATNVKIMKILEWSHISSTVWRLHSTKHIIFSACIIQWHIRLHHNGNFGHLQHFMLQTCSS